MVNTIKYLVNFIETGTNLELSGINLLLRTIFKILRGSALNLRFTGSKDEGIDIEEITSQIAKETGLVNILQTAIKIEPEMPSASQISTPSMDIRHCSFDLLTLHVAS